MSSKNRHLARVTALQALYELDITDHAVPEVMTARLEDQPLDEEMRQFAYKIVNGVLNYRQRMDNVIQRYAPEWPLDQIAVVDRNILRIAIFEFAIFRETPVKVSINEAVELAKDFGSESASRFINGVLGTLAAREEELQAAFEDASASQPQAKPHTN